MTTIAFDPAAFRAQFPAFGNANCASDAQLGLWATLASNYIGLSDSCCFMLNGQNRVAALNLMVAHIGTIFGQITTGDQPGFIKDASIDKVRVSIVPPPDGTQFMWWLGLTPYGQMLAALLESVTAGGTYVGGLPERAAFRRVGGGFGGIPPKSIC